ncbi:RNA polymerase sigma factor [Pedobacter metabolipauper]|uniref:RNA polymerase sigma-70 factor (ECF subfamily) n=1 Tax=Pedobacter metabolipauper TaxID=425513 RepID=A0A4R6SVK1_9SPHI|nr:sigma-70 family RNA polymerase sigma factor [Pedobacter metabolipauper]TDQ08479.1 RNA polymerase sigma-70 factor (ECF subfamily) [Pedobacter metabolipauper]
MSDYNSLSDLELVDFLRSGESGAFVELMERYSLILYKYSYGKLDDKDLAKDMVQSLFCDLWEKRERINVPGEFRPFIFTIIKNRLWNHFKHCKMQQRHIDGFRDYLQTAVDNADHLVRHNELSDLIAKEIATLPESMRVVIELSRNENLSRKEIALKLDLPQETVKKRMTRALEILRKRLGHSLILFL